MKHELGYVETYEEPQTRRSLEEALEFSVVVSSETRFVYNVKTKRIYEVINSRYKFVQHEEIIGQFKLETDDCYKFCIDMEYGRYASHRKLDYMSIHWLTLSEIYDPLPHKLAVLKPLTKQDLDRIEQYVDYEVKKFIKKSIELDRVYALEEDIKRLI